MASKLLLFLESKKIEISKFIEIFSSDTFSNNHQNIEKLILSLRHKSFDASSIMSFSDIFKNDFLLSNLEQICQIYCFMNDQKISYFDVIDIIKSGYLDSCKQQIDDLSEKIKLQESEIKNLSLELEKANQNLDLLRGQLNHLFWLHFYHWFYCLFYQIAMVLQDLFQFVFAIYFSYFSFLH